MEISDPKAFLLFALEHYQLKVTSIKENNVFLDRAYQIEIEQNNLFKLLHEGQVVAPFGDVEELCQFIKMDMQLNEKD